MYMHALIDPSRARRARRVGQRRGQGTVGRAQSAATRKINPDANDPPCFQIPLVPTARGHGSAGASTRRIR